MAKVWLMNVGRVPLYLLDCDVDGNSPQDRELTSRLYGGDMRTRIRQELVLGVGGVKALRALDIMPGVYHLNEGHSAFAPLEVIRQRMSDDGLTFDEALREVAHCTVFTTHTPVPAGHDRFPANLVEEHLGPLRDKLGISPAQLMGIGRVEPQNEHEPFCMTVIGLKLSRRANAVSSLHGYVSRRMWAHLWPWRVEEEIPIGHITNGVHIPTWLAYPMHLLYDRVLRSDWQEWMGDPKVWQTLYNVDPGELWETHSDLKNRLLDFVRRRVSRQIRRRNESDDAVEAARTMLDPERAHDRLRPPVRHVQAGRLVLPPAGPAGRADQRSAAAGAIHLRRQGPSGRRAGQVPHQEDREPAPRPPLRRADRVHRRLRHQRRPPPGARRRRVAQHAAPPEGSLRHERHEGRPQRRPQPLDPRRLVGRGLQRQERLRDRRRPATRR